MSALDRLAQMLAQQTEPPPIHLWQPPLSGDIDIHIHSNGEWFHEGSPMTRLALVKLFASILRRESDGHYYLVTPVEKWRIRVDDQPLLVTHIEVFDAGSPAQKILASTNTGQRVLMGSEHPLLVTTHPQTGEPKPLLTLLNGLRAKLTRPVFYEVIELAEQADDRLWLLSDGERFAVGALSGH